MVAAAAVASAIQAVLNRHEIDDQATAAAAPLSMSPHGDHTSSQQYMQDLYHRLRDITQIDTVCTVYIQYSLSLSLSLSFNMCVCAIEGQGQGVLQSSGSNRKEEKGRGPVGGSSEE